MGLGPWLSSGAGRQDMRVREGLVGLWVEGLGMLGYTEEGALCVGGLEMCQERVKPARETSSKFCLRLGTTLMLQDAKVTPNHCHSVLPRVQGYHSLAPHTRCEAEAAPVCLLISI